MAVKDDTELNTYLKQYMELTVKLINEVEGYNFENLDLLLQNREEVIERIKAIRYTEEEFKIACKAYNLVLLEKKLNDLIHKSKIELKNEIDKFSESKSANKGYNKKFSVDSLYFNKKI